MIRITLILEVLENRLMTKGKVNKGPMFEDYIRQNNLRFEHI